VIDQRFLPHSFQIMRLATVEQAAHAISEMVVRGAPLIGATAAYGVCLALLKDRLHGSLDHALELLAATRPTAVNLRWALEVMDEAVRFLPPDERVAAAYARAARICDDDVEISKSIGRHGLEIFKELAAAKGSGPLNILTHCNAGWLATVDWGTALAPIYMAHDEGMDVHVWVDETRPRNQGASLTAYELGAHGVPHSLVVDNVGGHLMQHGMVDVCIVGTDRTTAAGDVANKIGTYLKALAAHDNGVPFYVALPQTTIDWSARDGVAEIPIEERDDREVRFVSGLGPDGRVLEVEITPPTTRGANFAFDVTPARLVTGLITDRGVCDASLEGLLGLFPEWEDETTGRGEG
ncbi:MAG: S-methyl-5-thioribose-1-phosphate isomerase, partial [Thermoanaerobaculales bacterium]|nr:S-methyl-5-thioribose-1-phosphate isomerase [Thermoanaerobaculales bacterium]